MEFAIWAYPWDLLDEGVNAVANRLTELGIQEINLATNYHTVQAFLPHNPQRRTFFANASAFFQPSDTYAGLQPVTNKTMGDRCWLTEIIDALPDDITLTSWTIGCHNTRLGTQYPSYTITTPFGDDLRYGLCPSHPAVHQFLVDLVADLDARDVFDRIELESFDYFHGRGFGWHHDKFHTRLGSLGEFLFGLCFCDHCQGHASDRGIDVQAANDACRSAIIACAEGELDADIDPRAWLDGHPAVAAYVQARTKTLGVVFDDLRKATSSQLGYYPLLPPAQAWMHGADLSRLSSALDYHKVIAYESTPADAARAVQTADALTPDMPLHAGILPGHPHLHDLESTSGVVDAVIDAGASRLSFYNYGLLPERNLEWIGQATEPYR